MHIFAKGFAMLWENVIVSLAIDLMAQQVGVDAFYMGIRLTKAVTRSARAFVEEGDKRSPAKA